MLEILRKRMLLFVIMGFILGILCGFILPNFSIHLEFIGVIFLNLIKLMIVPLIFCAICLGVLDNNHQRIGKLLVVTIITFVSLFCITLLISLPIASFINPGEHFNTSLLAQTTAETAEPVTLVTITNNLIPTNIFEPFVTSNVLQIILITLIISIALIPRKKEIKGLIDTVRILSDITVKILDIIMLISPFAVFALIANTTATYGMDALLSLSEYIFTSYVLFFTVMIIVVIMPIKILTKFSFTHIIKSMLKVWVIAFSTASSTGTLPTTFKVVEEDFKVTKEKSRFILPLATTLNMIGGAVSFTTLSIFAINVSGVSVTPLLIIQMVVLTIIINMSAPGIPGGGIVLGTIYLTALGLPAEIMVLISGIYRIVDMAFTTINVSGDVVAAVIIDKISNSDEVNCEVIENE